MKRIGILGGTFNPPHIGHLIIANEIKYALNLDEVRLIPTATPPHKLADNNVTAQQRLRMVELALEGSEGLTVSSFEVDKGGVSYSYDTITSLKEIEPEAEFYFIIGADMVDLLPTWHKIDELVRIVTFIGVNRPGSLGETPYPVRFISIPEIDLSSTVLRARLAEGGTIKFLTPPAVESYIRQEGLYGSSAYEK
ncbi:nicotinate-nucleotide adenylyltransferase [Sporosarcina jiandibaonis]|uniref:nicotinate-nucleotide adenylyltransferase n=1 Tax=Sporosarcina jiandibaonis TaxID=2715535 RepID=UPI0015565AA2|nr:nicotinate-nucleotide adenylyltransferase [Sporosarcina jiandibaonis]